jgi:hypothetical protein
MLDRGFAYNPLIFAHDLPSPPAFSRNLVGASLLAFLYKRLLDFIFDLFTIQQEG